MNVADAYVIQIIIFCGINFWYRLIFQRSNLSTTQLYNCTKMIFTKINNHSIRRSHDQTNTNSATWPMVWILVRSIALFRTSSTNFCLLKMVYVVFCSNFSCLPLHFSSSFNARKLSFWGIACHLSCRIECINLRQLLISHKAFKVFSRFVGHSALTKQTKPQ
jgi:hypothetical protein